MKRLFALAAGVAACWALGAQAAPLEVYGRLPNIEEMAIAPDGSALAYILTDGEKRNVIVQNLSDDKVTHLVSAGDVKVHALDWVGTDHLIITSSKTTAMGGMWGGRREYFRASDFRLKEGRIVPLLSDAPYSMNTIAEAPHVRTVNGKPTLFLTGVYFPNNSYGVPALYEINLERDASRRVLEGSATTYDWLVGADGSIAAQTLYDARTQKWSLLLRDGGGWKSSRELKVGSERPSILGLGRDGRTVLIYDQTGDDPVQREVAPGADWGAPLPIDGDSSPIFDPITQRLIGHRRLIGDDEKYSFFDPQDQKVWNAVAAGYPGSRVTLVSWTDDRKKIVVRVDSPEQGPAYALVDLTLRKAKWLGPVYSKLTPADLSQVTPVRFKAADGLPLTGYLTLPRGREMKGLPLVVFPHGGPASRDEPWFDWWAQAMASRGYAVLQVNYRGSDGFGWKHMSAGFGEFGRKMQTDLSDGVRYLAGAGIVDPKRVCIVGASYGGYAALAGAALDPGVYRCAASFGGLSDLQSFVAWSKQNRGGLSSERYWLRFMGAEDERVERLAAISPARHVDAVSAPVLLIHGKDDTVVPLQQSQAMAEALKAAGKPYELVVLDSTDHWLTRGDTRQAMLSAVVAFLEKNNPPR